MAHTCDMESNNFTVQPSALQAALSTLNVNSTETSASSHLKHTPYNSPNTSKNTRTPHTGETEEKVSSSGRLANRNYSTNALLETISANGSNAHLELASIKSELAAQRYELNEIKQRQDRTNELLHDIYCLMSSFKPTISASTPSGSSDPGNNVAAVDIRKYGFSNSTDVAAELLLKIIRVMDQEVRAKGISYVSTRTFDKSYATSVIKAVCHQDFKENEGEASGALKLPENKHEATKFIVTRIATPTNLNVLFSAASITDLMNDVTCRVFIAVFQQILLRIRKVRLAIPFYEADLISAVDYPFFNKHGELICDWDTIKARSETQIEADIVSLKATPRHDVILMLSRGVRPEYALHAAKSRGSANQQ